MDFLEFLQSLFKPNSIIPQGTQPASPADMSSGVNKSLPGASTPLKAGAGDPASILQVLDHMFKVGHIQQQANDLAAYQQIHGLPQYGASQQLLDVIKNSKPQVPATKDQ